MTVSQNSIPNDEAWHALKTEEVLLKLGVSVSGLSPEEVDARRRACGENIIQTAPREKAYVLLWRQLNQPINYVLIISTVIAIMLGKVVDGIVVIGAVILNTLIGFLQESRAGKAIEALMALVPEESVVLRAGARHRVPSRELVPGDVILLQSGDKVPADARLLESSSLRIEEAALTGESVPAEKSVGVVSSDSGIGDRTDMVHGGTIVRFGTAKAVVTAIGAATELGRISTMLQQTSQVETPLTQQLSRVGKTMTWAIVALGGGLFGVALLRGYPAADAMLAAITLAVAAIPEGLPTVITVALAMGVRRMAARNAVVRRLPAVETLGSTTVVCTDKTGTLTRNEMMAREAWCRDGSIRFQGDGIASPPETQATGGFRELLACGVLCNEATLKLHQGSPVLEGDPTESALLVAAHKAGLPIEQIRTEYPRIDSVAFESERQFMATLHSAKGEEKVALMKGASEVVLGRCSRALNGAELVPQAIHAQVERMTARGMRVLAFAQKKLDRTVSKFSDEHLREMEFLGLQGMIDPPRPEAMAAVKKCHAAGVTVKMITGDHRGTARSIAAELGILGSGGVLTGAELARMSDAEFSRRACETHVFARVAPEHKLKLVRVLQKRGDVVAMTGDGVNDAPALKQADIGIAMGINGTAAAKESAKMVLADDNFATIAAAVEEGRRIFDNLIKSMMFMLPANMGMAAVLLFSVLFFPIADGYPLLPITPVQTLWINLVTGVALAFPLAVEVLEPNAMSRPPRRSGAPLLDRSIMYRMLSVAAVMAIGSISLFLYEYYLELEQKVPAATSLREAQTMTVTAITLFQVFYLLTCRSFQAGFWKQSLLSNRALIGGISIVILLQFCFIYLKPMNGLFNSIPLDTGAWAVSVLVAFTIVPIIEIEKAVRRRRQRNSGDSPQSGCS